MNLRRTAAAALATLVLLAGCSEGSRSPVAPEPASPRPLLGIADTTGLLVVVSPAILLGPQHAERYIRAAEGGSVTLNGYRVNIPAGALPSDTLVTIDLPSTGLLSHRLVAEFGPHGVQFNQPVTLSFPLTGVVLAGLPIEVARWENDGWTSLGGRVNLLGLSLSAETEHFSLYGGKYVMAGG